MTDFAAPRLDDLYRMVAYIYGDKNLNRTSTSTFAHFVEVCGMLTIHDRKKRREGVDVTDALCKALGWYFPLLAKMKIRSVEELVFRKFPNACPYCRSKPHREADCKLVRGTSPTVDHVEVARLYNENWNTRPSTLDGWQKMFQEIYPRQLEEHGRSTIGLLEELGEMAEAVRVFEQHPKYFLGEAADLFSYIMGIANEHSMRLMQENKYFSFDEEFQRRYPGLCPQCGSRLCICPAVPAATVGRMAKELAISEDEKPFIENLTEFFEDGERVGHQVLEALGGYAGLTSQLPFDRGDTNRALIALCLRVADAVEKGRPELAESLRAEAFRISMGVQQPGSPKSDLDVASLLQNIQHAWSDLDAGLKNDIKSKAGLLGEIGGILDTHRVLFVGCSPTDEKAIRVAGELRIILESVRRGEHGKTVFMDQLPAATAVDLRRKLLERPFDILHFAGHANETHLVFEDEFGGAADVPLTAIAELIKIRPTIKCVILNACEAGKQIKEPISECTIAVDDKIEDAASIEFSRGFYDGLAAGNSIRASYLEGLTAVRMAGLDSGKIRLIE